jgi:hypothetical protein
MAMQIKGTIMIRMEAETPITKVTGSTHLKTRETVEAVGMQRTTMRLCLKV